ncbi:MAG: hypothetical protein ABW116_18230 [Candidatus Sedimenticola sp. 20ELBAFRAG]
MSPYKLITILLLLPAASLTTAASQPQVEELVQKKQGLEAEQKTVEETLEATRQRLRELERKLMARRLINAELDRRIAQAAQVMADSEKPGN